MVRGLKYRKLDLHLHTPASRDFEDSTVTPQQFVETAIQRGLDGIAITDHNTGAWVDEIKSAAKDTELVVFPGVEITCQGGKEGLHIIALFDPTCSQAHIETLLSRLGLDPEQYGDLSAVVNKSPIELAKIVEDMGGLTVLAHANSTRGALQDMSGQQRTDLIQCPCVHAAEGTDFDNEDKKNKHRRVVDLLDGSDPVYKRKMAVYQASDNPGVIDGSHGLSGIGRRYSYFKMEKINLESLKQCIHDRDVRIRQEGELRAENVPHIQKIKVSGGFLDGAEVVFHEGLNSILGGKGAGKSLLVELMRFSLSQESSVPSIREDHESKLQNRLMEYSRVEITVKTITGDSRTFVRELRSGENSPYEPELGLDVAQYFPVLFLSQNEIITIAEDNKAQLKFLDQFFDFKAHQSTILDLEQQIQILDQKLANTIDAYDQHNLLAKQIAELSNEIEKMDKSLKSANFDEYSKAEAKTNAFVAQLAFLDQLFSDFDSEQEWADTLVLPELQDDLQADPALKRSSGFVTQLKSDVISHYENLIETLKKARAKVEAEYNAWKPAYKLIAKKYQDFVRVSQADYKELVQQRAKKKQRQEALKQRLTKVGTESKQMYEIAKKRKALIVQLHQAHQAYSKERQDKCAALEAQSLGRLKIIINESDDRGVFRNKLSALKKGSYLRDNDIVDIVDKVTPTTFISSLINYRVSGDIKKLETISNESGLDQSKVIGLADWLLAENELTDLLALQYKAIPQDRPEICLRVGEEIYEPLNKLSVGQKCAAMLIIALSDGAKPIIIDQPEDSLDLCSIWEDVCVKLRGGKESRQFIFTTHNSSLAVASDTDTYTILEGDANNSRVLHSGALDHAPLKDAVMDYLEGGVPTYKKKFDKYNAHIDMRSVLSD